MERNKVEAINLTSIVSDNGMGMTREELKNVTQPFYQVGRNIEHAQDGVGLGLSIVQHLVDLHNGKLIFASRKGKGTTVKVVL